MKNTFKNTINLPAVQQAFINQFDGTLESVLKFEKLAQVLNPTFTAHYFYVSGTTDSNTITTKSTDGSSAYYGKQTPEEMENAHLLGLEVRKFILEHKPTQLQVLVNYNHEAMRRFASKISQVRTRAAFVINGEIVLVPGLKIA